MDCPMLHKQRKEIPNVIYNHYCTHRAVFDWRLAIKPPMEHPTSRKILIKMCNEVTAKNIAACQMASNRQLCGALDTEREDNNKRALK
jgi:hypothetical protein